MRHFGGGLRSESLKRAYKMGNRIKHDACCICGKPIYNRMVYRVSPDNLAGGIYAHTSCSKTQPQYEWEMCW